MLQLELLHTRDRYGWSSTAATAVRSPEACIAERRRHGVASQPSSHPAGFGHANLSDEERRQVQYEARQQLQQARTENAAASEQFLLEQVGLAAAGRL